MKNRSAVQDRMHTLSEKASGVAFRFVLTMGIVNLFADTTYEGGASINGPFLGSLGAKAAAISIIAGVGEFLGYSLRAVSGYIADRTGRHWQITFIGYGINLLVVPAMALAHSWQAAAALILAEPGRFANLRSKQCSPTRRRSWGRDGFTE